jgi:hypothetical protein
MRGSYFIRYVTISRGRPDLHLPASRVCLPGIAPGCLFTSLLSRSRLMTLGVIWPQGVIPAWWLFHQHTTFFLISSPHAFSARLCTFFGRELSRDGTTLKHECGTFSTSRRMPARVKMGASSAHQLVACSLACSTLYKVELRYDGKTMSRKDADLTQRFCPWLLMHTRAVHEANYRSFQHRWEESPQSRWPSDRRSHRAARLLNQLPAELGCQG